MSIPLEKIYDIFYSSLNLDLEKYPSLDISVDDNIIAVYLDSAIYDYEENLGTVLTIDESSSQINEDISKSHAKILGKLIYRNYLDRELYTTLELSNSFNKRSELNVTGLQSKIVALRECIKNTKSELDRSFTRNMLKGVNSE